MSVSLHRIIVAFKSGISRNIRLLSQACFHSWAHSCIGSLVGMSHFLAFRLRSNETQTIKPSRTKNPSIQCNHLSDTYSYNRLQMILASLADKEAQDTMDERIALVKPTKNRRLFIFHSLLLHTVTAVALSIKERISFHVTANVFSYLCSTIESYRYLLLLLQPP